MAIIIRCFRTDNPEVLEVPGMTITKCENCGLDVWIAPSSLALKEKLKANVVCNICGDIRIQEDEPRIIPLTNEQITDIQDGLWNRKTRN